MALIRPLEGDLILAQRGPLVGVFGVLASFVRHNDWPPARMQLELFGSRTKGAMNRARWLKASGIWKGTGFHSQCRVRPFQNWPVIYRSPPVSSLVAPSTLRWMLRNTYCP